MPFSLLAISFNLILPIVPIPPTKNLFSFFSIITIIMLTTTMQWWVDQFWRIQSEIVQVIPSALTKQILSWRWFLVLFVGTVVLYIPLHYILHYRSSIRRRLNDMERRLSRGLIYRDTVKPPAKLVRALELHPPFVQAAQDQGWRLSSLGQYLSTLRLNQLDDDTVGGIPKVLERELEATIGSVLLQNLGPRMGAALLPMLGISQVDSWIAKVASGIASWVVSHILVEVSSEWDPSMDRAAFPLAVSEIVAFVNLNQKVRSNSRAMSTASEATDDDATSTATKTTTTPLEWMNRGEIGYTPTFAHCTTADDDTSNKELIPNPFVMERDFDAAIAGLEDQIRAQDRVTAMNSPNAEHVTTTATYDPEDRSMPEPVPINERILPGLHMGWGDAKCTHTKREILRNRLLAVLLTKLSYNFHLVEQQQQQKAAVKLFTVDYKGTLCRYPDEFVAALLDHGHTIEVCPRSTITTFGIAACVKEDNDSWTNIPIAFFFRTGYERRDGRPAYFSAPHGGLDLSITSGPLLGKEGTKCDIQFYVAIEGLCGWHSNHNADVPWVRAVSTTEIYDRNQTLQAVRMAGLLAVTFNSLATKMNLPFGGYGVLGVCNDSAAFIDFALRGETNMYPLISTGRFLFHTGRRLLELEKALVQREDLVATAAADVRRLVTAACNLDSDIHNSPSQLIGATRRYLANNPQSFFQLTEDSKAMMSAVAKIYEEYVEFEGVGGKKANNVPQVPDFVNFLFQSNVFNKA